MDINYVCKSLPHVVTNIATPSCAVVTYHVCHNRTLCQVCTCVLGCVPALMRLEYLINCHQIWEGNSVSSPLDLCLHCVYIQYYVSKYTQPLRKYMQISQTDLVSKKVLEAKYDLPEHCFITIFSQFA